MIERVAERTAEVTVYRMNEEIINPVREELSRLHTSLAGYNGTPGLINDFRSHQEQCKRLHAALDQRLSTTQITTDRKIATESRFRHRIKDVWFTLSTLAAAGIGLLEVVRFLRGR